MYNQSRAEKATHLKASRASIMTICNNDDDIQIRIM
jgi:hypothetical protein